MSAGDDNPAAQPTKLRFIAGARCPECGAMDRIKVGPDPAGAGLLRLCVACGFSDSIDSLGAVSEPANRLVPAAEPASTPVRLLDPRKPSA